MKAKKFKNILKKLFSIVRKETSGNSILNEKQIRNLAEIPRYKSGSIQTNVGLIKFVDSCTLISGNKQIFKEQVYNFNTTSTQPCIIDCGANIGLATIYFKLLYPNSEVIAIEPDPEIFNCLKSNLDSISIEDKVTAINSAAWIHANNIEFDTEGGYSGQIKKYGHENVKNTIVVPTVRLRDIISSRVKIDMLKIDIEGAELDVLEDNRDNLKHVHHIFIEYHSHKGEAQELDRILQILKENGFRYHIKEAYTMRQPFVERDTLLGMDLQLDIFGFRTK